ncbi:hypothetical protein WICMUC_005043 [Wickerhamomyces mucosus]|uniref:Major facilitator superfamily (MFS) profile domain-containing protein n=1 Tax=Wickerhamomyces mucosus TaxID=1378264 RepID=A0A9P8PD04_9ASCO|nr:hypothetical protein WICMUC_005043 [Wickerhamomyces mucosus]
MSKDRRLSAESLLLLASEDIQDLSPNPELDPLLPTINEEDDADFSILEVKNLFKIETSLLLNVFLAAFDGTVTASTYTIIGSEFNAAHLGSWITTSYLITSTAFQPLYGTFSDVLGRRICYFFATSIFALGCVGCSFATDIYSLFLFRSLTGIGGGGLITLSTVVNSDLIPISKRGLFQGFQNILIGVGSILGASLGGVISETVGWRFCFLIQVPVSLTGLIFGFLYLENQKDIVSSKGVKDIDIQGSFLLIIGLTLQLLALNTGSYLLFVASIIVLYIFVAIEFKTERIPIIPFKRIQGPSNYLVLFISTLTGFANYGYIFILPLLFQIALDDTPSKAGLRLGIPSLFTSVGALLTAFFMNRNVKNLNYLVHVGVLLLGIGNGLALFISKSFPEYLLNFLLIPANCGLGMSNPALLFSFIFEFPKSMQASSTSTLYLFRAIGQVWGVATVSIIVQTVLKSFLVDNFAKDQPDLSPDVIDGIIEKVTRSISYINTLPTDIQRTVKASYEISIRYAQVVSTVICIVCFLLCLFRDFIKK